MRRFFLGSGVLIFISSCQPKLSLEVKSRVDTINVLSNKLFVLDSIIDKTDPGILQSNQVDSFVRITLDDYATYKILSSKNKELSEMIQNEPQLMNYEEVRSCGQKVYPLEDRFEIQEKANQAMEMSLDYHSTEGED